MIANFLSPKVATFLLSFLPILEVKGAIPLAMNSAIFGDRALTVWQAFFFAILGSSLAIPFVAGLFKPVLNFLEKFKFFSVFVAFLNGNLQKRAAKFEKSEKNCEKLNENSEKMDKKFTENSLKNEKLQKNDEKLKNKSKKTSKIKKKLSKMLAVFCFVAFPVPLTGVWTGAALGVVLGLSFSQICISAFFGNLLCGLLVVLSCSAFPNASNVFLLIFLLFLIVALTYRLLKVLAKRR